MKNGLRFQDDQTRIGTSLLALEAFLSGFPKIDSAKVDEIFFLLSQPNLVGSLLERFNAWKHTIPATMLMTAAEVGDHPSDAVLFHVLKFAESVLERNHDILMGTVPELYNVFVMAAGFGFTGMMHSADTGGLIQSRVKGISAVDAANDALIKAVETNKTTAMEYVLLRRPPTLRASADFQEGEPLVRAVEHGSYNAVWYLLEVLPDFQRPDVNLADNAALFAAIAREDFQIVHLLLQHGAEVTPLMVHRASPHIREILGHVPERRQKRQRLNLDLSALEPKSSTDILTHLLRGTARGSPP